jgi:hypothetical protein
LKEKAKDILQKLDINDVVRAAFEPRYSRAYREDAGFLSNEACGYPTVKGEFPPPIVTRVTGGKQKEYGVPPPYPLLKDLGPEDFPMADPIYEDVVDKKSGKMRPRTELEKQQLREKGDAWSETIAHTLLRGSKPKYRDDFQYDVSTPAPGTWMFRHGNL